MKSAVFVTGLSAASALKMARVASHMEAMVARSPMSQVVNLFKQIKAQLVEDAAQEAADYDKIACHCKEMQPKTVKNIQFLTGEVRNYNETMNAARARRDAAQSLVNAATTKIGTLNGKKTTQTGLLQESQVHEKRQVTLLKFQLQQVNQATAMVRKMLRNSDTATMNQFNKIEGEVRKSLAESMKTFEDTQAALNKDIANLQADLEDTQSHKDTENLKLAAATEKHDDSKDRYEKNADDLDKEMKYGRDLTEKCVEQKRLFDARSTDFKEEIAAISGALSALTNKLDDSGAVVKDHRGVAVANEMYDSEQSFLQLASIDTHAKSPMASEALRLVQMAAKGNNRKGIEDVISMIHTKVADLQIELAAEGGEKTAAENMLATLTAAKDQAAADVATQDGIMFTMTNNIEKDTISLAHAEENLKDKQTTLKDVRDERNRQEKAFNKFKQISDDGINGLKAAKKVLRQYYDNTAAGAGLGAGLGNKGAMDEEADVTSARGRKAVSNAFDSDRAGSSAGKKAMQMVETILANTEKSLRLAQAEETKADMEFDLLEADLIAEVGDGKEVTGSIPTAISVLKGDIRMAKSLRAAAKTALVGDGAGNAGFRQAEEDATKALSLQQKDVFAHKSFKEQQAEINKEIDALQDAENIIRNYLNENTSD